MTCKDCEAAATKVWALFTAGCTGCQARAVARSAGTPRARAGRRRRTAICCSASR